MSDGDEPNYYELLDVTPDATVEEIRQAYRRQVRNVHPDAGGTSGMFRLLTVAYKALTDPELRAWYDHHYLGSPAPGPRPGATNRAGGRERPADESGSGPAGPEPDGDDGEEEPWREEYRASRMWTRPRRRWREESKPRWEPMPHDFQFAPTTLLDRAAAWLTFTSWCTIVAVLLVWPDTLVPAGAHPDDALTSVTSWGARWLIVVIVVVYSFFAFSSSDGNVFSTFWLHGVTLAVAAGWPLAYAGVATAGEWWFFLSLMGMWAAWAVALAFNDELHHRRWDGVPNGPWEPPPGGWPEKPPSRAGRPFQWLRRQLAWLPRLSGYGVAVAVTVGSFLAIAYVMIVDPDLIIPAAAGPDFTDWWVWYVALPVVVFYGFAALGAADQGSGKGLGGLHALAGLCGLAWMLAYWDLATTGERWTFGAFAGIWLVYRAGLWATPRLGGRGTG